MSANEISGFQAMAAIMLVITIPSITLGMIFIHRDLQAIRKHLEGRK